MIAKIDICGHIISSNIHGRLYNSKSVWYIKHNKIDIEVVYDKNKKIWVSCKKPIDKIKYVW